ncbi:sensor histidine kinase [Longibacter sp.]|uniref:sensor histidine kinase n=1 Tax=Longibacter sp. TaxID=2045415 RepID=UPI003EBF09AB
MTATNSHSSRPASLVWTGGLVAVGLLLGVICAVQMYAFQSPNADRTLAELLVYTVPTWGPWILATPGIVWLGRHVPLGRGTWLRALPVYVFTGIAVTAVHLGFFAYWTLQAAPSPPNVAWSRFTIGLLGSEWVFVNLFVFGLIVGGHQAFRYAREARTQKLEASRLEAQLQAARFKALKMQLHPHFLFNTINAISTLVLKQDTERATAMLDRLSTFLRMALEERDAQTVPLARELAFADAYLSIERVRFSDRLSVETQVDEEVRRAEVPHLILQPLVENAVRHGIAPLERAGTLRIEATRVGRRLRLVVEDDGVGLSDDVGTNGRQDAPSDKDGLGLAMTRDRLQAAYGTDHAFRVMAGEEGGVRVVVELPIEAGDENGHDPAFAPSEGAATQLDSR